MSDSYSIQCSHCESRLRLKDRSRAGHEIDCPKCGETFTIKLPKKRKTKDPLAARLPPRKKKRDPSPIPKKKRREPVAEEEEPTGLSVGELFSRVIWINALIAAAWCIADNAMDFFWLITHFGDVVQQVGIGRLAVRQMGRPLFVIVVTFAVVWHTVWPRDISTRPLAFMVGGGFLLLFGVVAKLMDALISSAYGSSGSGVQMSVIYLGVSLIVFGIWGFGPETPVQYAERLMANGSFHDALIVVQEALERDPDNMAAVKLESTLRDIVKGR